MNIVIRADASVHIGSGHVMRCLVLAQELQQQGHHVRFACRRQLGHSIDFIVAKGFKVLELIPVENESVPQNTADYAAWLQVSWDVDAASFINEVGFADLVIVDHYGLNKNWQSRVRDTLSCKIFVIDDLVREHDADIILDQTLLRTAQEYQLTNPSSKMLMGCDFALLNPMFAGYREKALELMPFSDVANILVTMGGIDQPNATLSVLRALSLSAQAIKVTVLLSERAPHYQIVKSFCDGFSWITHIDFVDNMAHLMLEHDIAIGAPGSTTWERACLGIPAVIIPLADNQLTISQKMRAVNAAISLDVERIEAELLTAIEQIKASYSTFKATNLGLCDGLGVKRVVANINALSIDASQINIRRANNTDIDIVYQWQCHENTRRYALNPSIPTFSEHETWMSNKVIDKNHYFYLIELNEIRVGVVRLDRLTAGEYVVSIFISPDYYGQGLAKQALNYIDYIHAHVTIHATVFKDNIASQKLFLSANYQRTSDESFIRTPVI
ncbi:MAG: UDP-2,4-diacetamido-2,4,6-trideoxy-beta-L-altropyranose hydrolase [Moritella sp.]|uniref:UDP-2,4-diacetamido-2,4, 6-trideoxy-beta-L-altropyranose hydrolase n=1 Tax=Moritella sp. TaxID=78556 RepID=UPI0029B76E3A|nr:UDP-2,4-diacetamido-2,4,6-trideoxy-beta-L-altropyranose hydrolase [Moritella sp.]MDX2320731.1 UDP-2,4-diacetamido-2,4,6-trideoxy-beta-L-altropyranose hydrolase [Moritella sp.]